MSKFCGNCGAQLNGTEKVCGYCGFALNNEPANTGDTSTPGIASETDTAKAEKTKNFIKIGAIAVVAVVVLSIGISIISSCTGYKAVVKKVINAFEDYDMETLYSCASTLCYLDYADADYWEEIFDNRTSNKLDYYEDQLGHSLKMKYKIVDSYELDERRFNNIVEEFEDYGADTYDVDKIRIVEIELTIKGSKRTNTYTIDDLWLVKEDGKWKVLYYYDYY